MPGATIRLSSAGVDFMWLDFAWEDAVLSDPEPRGAWWGPLQQYGGGGPGEWRWERDRRYLLLTVHVPESIPEHARYVGELFDFDLPPVLGSTGQGRVVAAHLPTEPVPFDWTVPAGT